MGSRCLLKVCVTSYTSIAPIAALQLLVYMGRALNFNWAVLHIYNCCCCLWFQSIFEMQKHLFNRPLPLHIHTLHTYSVPSRLQQGPASSLSTILIFPVCFCSCDSSQFFASYIMFALYSINAGIEFRNENGNNSRNEWMLSLSMFSSFFSSFQSCSLMAFYLCIYLCMHPSIFPTIYRSI